MTFNRKATLLGVFLSVGVSACDSDEVGIKTEAAAIGTHDYMPNQYVVVLAKGARGSAVATRHGLRMGLELGPQAAVVMKDVSDAQLALLAGDPDVFEIRLDPIAYASGKPQAAQVLPAGVDRVGADETLNTGAAVTVCITDTGVDYNHTDLAASYVGGWDFINDDSDPIDDNGHGTHVAGTIAAANNATDVVGVAPGVKIVAAKVLSRRGSGSYSGITAGVNYCVAQGAKVINMSLGGSVDDATLKSALESAKAAGVTVVVAAGNSGVNLDTSPEYPAAYDGTVITVSAAVVGEAARAFGSPVSFPYWSNYGSAVDLAAPGSNVLSTKKNGGTTYMSGTSMACPHVAAAAAMYVFSHPAALPDEVELALEAAVEDVSNTPNHPEELLNVRSL